MEDRLEALMQSKPTEARVNEIYDYLVEETGNQRTIHDKKKAQLLHNLLSVFEYILNGEDNPLGEIFESE